MSEANKKGNQGDKAKTITAEEMLKLVPTLLWKLKMLEKMVELARGSANMRQELEDFLEETWRGMGYEDGVPMMACGHSPQAVNQSNGLPVCVICLGSPEAELVVENPASLQGRRARCTYYGQKPHHNESDGCAGKGICDCEVPSRFDLAFFRYHPKREYDEFYCGCRSWD